MRGSLLILALLALSAAVYAEDRDALFDEDHEDVSESDLTLDDLQEMSLHVKAAAAAAGASEALDPNGISNDRYRAPAIVPRDTMNEFARELDRIKKHLEALIAKLGPLLEKDKREINLLKDKIKAEEAKAAAIRKKMRDIIRRAKRTDTKEYKAAHAKLTSELNKLKASLFWIKSVEKAVHALKNSAPGLTNYETILAEVKKTLAENAEVAQEVSNIDIVSELQVLEAPRVNFDVDAASDLQIDNVKMYETSRLRDLVGRMRKALDKKIHDVKHKLAHLHEAKIPKHLHIGLRNAERNIRDLKRQLAEAERKYNKAHREDIPKLAAAKRELQKIHRIERHIYHSQQGGNGNKNDL